MDDIRTQVVIALFGFFTGTLFGGVGATIAWKTKHHAEKVLEKEKEEREP